MIIPQEVTAEAIEGSVAFDAGMSSAEAPAPHVFRRVDVEGRVAPPSTNRGVQNTSASESALIDWFACTFPPGFSLEGVLTFFGARQEWSDADQGGGGYLYCKMRGDVKVFYGGREDMGVHVVATGKGCRQLEAEGLVEEGWQGVVGWLLELRANITRIDFAADDRNGLLSLDKVQGAIDAGQVVSRFKQSRTMEAKLLKDGTSKGRTIYFGSSMSEMAVRMYDKAKEQLLGEDVHWIRVEVQARKGRAQALAGAFVQGGFVAVVGVLRGYLDFRESSSDSNRSRWRSCDWWLSFLGWASKLKLGIAPLIRTLEKSYSWIQKQVAPTLAMLALAVPDWPKTFGFLLSNGVARLRPWQLSLVGPVVLFDGVQVGDDAFQRVQAGL
jgi:phage replication initiation protein